MVQQMLAMTTTDRRIQETISDLMPGECAYVAPSALVVTADRACHLQTDVPVRHTPDGTASMQVTRTAGGYIADITYCHFKWTTTDWADCQPYAPVAHVVFGDEFLS